MSIRRPFPALLVLCVLLLAGCAAPRLGGPSAESVNLMATPQLTAEADKAYAKRDWARSELYYDRLLARADLPPQARPLAAKRLAASAFENRHYNQTRAALEAWARADQKALDDWQWHDLNIRSLAALGKQAGLEEQRAWLAAHPEVSWEVRQRSALAFFDVFSAEGSDLQALQALGDAYRLAPDAKSRAGLEKEFQARVTKLGDRDLKRLVQAAPAETRTAFPAALVEFEQARRAAKDKDDWAESWRSMRAVLAASQLESKDSLGRELRDLEKKRGVPRSGVALALPLTGRFGDVGRRIARGAAVAQWALANTGQDVEVRVVNTDAPGWPGRLNDLPGYFNVVGGPLQTESFKEMEAAGLHFRRSFFAFVPSLASSRRARRPGASSPAPATRPGPRPRWPWIPWASATWPCWPRKRSSAASWPGCSTRRSRPGAAGWWPRSPIRPRIIQSGARAWRGFCACLSDPRATSRPRPISGRSICRTAGPRPRP